MDENKTETNNSVVGSELDGSYVEENKLSDGVRTSYI